MLRICTIFQNNGCIFCPWYFLAFIKDTSCWRTYSYVCWVSIRPNYLYIVQVSVSCISVEYTYNIWQCPLSVMPMRRIKDRSGIEVGDYNEVSTIYVIQMTQYYKYNKNDANLNNITQSKSAWNKVFKLVLNMNRPDFFWFFFSIFYLWYSFVDDLWSFASLGASFPPLLLKILGVWQPPVH